VEHLLSPSSASSDEPDLEIEVRGAASSSHACLALLSVDRLTAGTTTPSLPDPVFDEGVVLSTDDPLGLIARPTTDAAADAANANDPLPADGRSTDWRAPGDPLLDQILRDWGGAFASTYGACRLELEFCCLPRDAATGVVDAKASFGYSFASEEYYDLSGNGGHFRDVFAPLLNRNNVDTLPNDGVKVRYAGPETIGDRANSQYDVDNNVDDGELPKGYAAATAASAEGRVDVVGAAGTGSVLYSDLEADSMLEAW